MEMLKKIILVFAVLLFSSIVLVAFGFIQSKNNGINSTTQAGVFTPPSSGSFNCPQNYCSSWVFGSCIAHGIRYAEKQCYTYPQNAANLSDCELKKAVSFIKANQTDASC